MNLYISLLIYNTKTITGRQNSIYQGIHFTGHSYDLIPQFQANGNIKLVVCPTIDRLPSKSSMSTIKKIRNPFFEYLHIIPGPYICKYRRTIKLSLKRLFSIVVNPADPVKM